MANISREQFVENSTLPFSSLRWLHGSSNHRISILRLPLLLPSFCNTHLYSPGSSPQLHLSSVDTPCRCILSKTTTLSARSSMSPPVTSEEYMSRPFTPSEICDVTQPCSPYLLVNLIITSTLLLVCKIMGSPAKATTVARF